MKKIKPVLIIGGGISGITSAVELAETGQEVILVEKEAYLGGNVIRMNNYFPKLCPPSCGLEINFRRIKNSSRISLMTQTEVREIIGEKGDFVARLESKPEYINDNCTSCGKCAEVCPAERNNAFDLNLSKTKATYLSHEMAFPDKYVIDGDVCLGEACNKCREVCEYDAINLKAEATGKSIEVSSVIVASGWENYNANKIENLHYSEFSNIVTNLEFERLISPSGPGKGKLERPSDKKLPKEIAFVQCAGSRDENHLPYCSSVCCSASLKHALNIQEKYPDAKVKIFYIDLRVAGRNEDFLLRVQENKNIELIKGKVAAVSEGENGNLILEAEDILSGRKIKYNAEMAVLATGIVPSLQNFDLNRNPKGFGNLEQKDGIYISGCAKKPMDVSACVKDSTSVALKAIQN